MTYRSAEDALVERTAALEAELRTLEQKRASATAIDGAIARVVGELQKTRALLDRVEKKRGLPMLDQIRVASPCDASWAEMTGDDKARFCGKCEKHVFNLSAMTREEAELVMLEREGSICVRLYRRKDGTVITADCPVGVRRKRLRLVGVLAIGGGVVAAGAGFAAAMFTRTQGEVGPPRASGCDKTQPTASSAPFVPPRDAVPTMGEAPMIDEPPAQVEMGAKAPSPVKPIPAPKAPPKK
jgi:hypothetical protein